MKPVIYVANVSEEDYANPEGCKYFKTVKEFASSEGSECIAISAGIEAELVGLDKEEKDEYLSSLGVTETGLDRLVKSSYKLLNLSTFFTVGADEVRAWTFKSGYKAPQCAGIIHTDFERGFLRAEIYSYENLMEYKTEQSLKEHGKIRLEGKEVHLTQIEYQLLTLLAENSGRVLTYSFIMNAIWGPYMDNNNQILRVNMANIRRKIEKNPAQPEYVFTEIGIGYRMLENQNQI
jgi:hypothetical protein